MVKRGVKRRQDNYLRPLVDHTLDSCYFAICVFGHPSKHDRYQPEAVCEGSRRASTEGLSASHPEWASLSFALCRPPGSAQSPHIFQLGAPEADSDLGVQGATQADYVHFGGSPTTGPNFDQPEIPLNTGARGSELGDNPLFWLNLCPRSPRSTPRRKSAPRGRQKNGRPSNSEPEAPVFKRNSG